MAHFGHYDCVIFGDDEKSKNYEISCIFVKTLVLCIICSNCENKNEKMFKEEEPIEILKILSLMKYIYLL